VHGSSGVLIVYVVALAVIVFIFRANRRKQKAAAGVRSSIEPGTEVMTTAGLYGTIVEVLEDSSVIIEAAPGVHLHFDRRAISRVVPPSTPEPDEPTEPEDPNDSDHPGS
jgi:preprotein translocase subunit YajC